MVLIPPDVSERLARVRRAEFRCLRCRGLGWVPGKGVSAFAELCPKCDGRGGFGPVELATRIGVTRHELARVRRVRVGSRAAARVLDALLAFFPELAAS